MISVNASGSDAGPEVKTAPDSAPRGGGVCFSGDFEYVQSFIAHSSKCRSEGFDKYRSKPDSKHVATAQRGLQVMLATRKKTLPVTASVSWEGNKPGIAIRKWRFISRTPRQRQRFGFIVSLDRRITSITI